MVKISKHIQKSSHHSASTNESDKKDKIVVLLSDVLSLRNFLYTNFHQTAADFDLLYWNSTPADLDELSFKKVEVKEPHLNALTDILKRSRQYIELNQNRKKSNDKIYQLYKLPFVNANIKAVVKNIAIKCLTSIYSSERGIAKIRKNIHANERRTESYIVAKMRLIEHQPAMVFCTSQRASNAIIPILAARDLDIPTATFIYSWDNMPKATLLVETDYYFVWSKHMKQELLHYYPFVSEDQIIITGTPQFEMHYNKKNLMLSENFRFVHGLQKNTRYICFSGDDATTSPNDPYYLEDVAIAVRQFKSEGEDIGIVFRRCPIDFSERFDKVLEAYSDVITSIDPVWNKDVNTGKVFPTADDTALLLDTINNTEFVINLGSSMVFDYALFGKPTAYIRYDVLDKPLVNSEWTVNNIYRFVHFRSMPSEDAVAWIRSPEEIYDILKDLLRGEQKTVASALEWFKVINCDPADRASERIVAACHKIIKSKHCNS